MFSRRSFRAILTCVVLAGVAAGCEWWADAESDGEQRPEWPADLLPIPEIFRTDWSGIGRETVAASTGQEWDSLWSRVTSRRSAAQPRVDFVLHRVVAVGTGGGSSGAPDVRFAGWRTEGDSVAVYLDWSYPCDGCPIPADVVHLTVVGLIPQDTLPVRFGSRWRVVP